jgi:hypothetical protein
MVTISKQGWELKSFTTGGRRTSGEISLRDAVPGQHDVSCRYTYAWQSVACILLVSLAPVIGSCAPATDDASVVAGAQGSVSNSNRLSMNRLALNRLALNRLALNRLALNGVISGGMGAGELLATEEGREILAYVVQCALAEDDVLTATVDEQTYEFPGLLGLAPAWEHQPIGLDAQRLISACLLAHVNALGVSVSISVRAHGVVTSTPDERRDYPVYEGTFFGQLFDGQTMWAYACQGSLGEAAREHSEDRALRRCTDDTTECAITAVGRCRDVCQKRSEDEGWTECWAQGVLYEDAISVYLFADDPDDQNQRCQSNHCDMANLPDTAAILDCNGKKHCSATCAVDGTCSIDGSKGKHVDIEVAGAQLGEVDCYKGKSCNVECTDQASCDVECTDGKGCGVACSEGAHCTVDCSHGEDCAVECAGDSSCNVDCYRGEDCDVRCTTGSDCNVRCGGGHDSCDRVDCKTGSSCTIECKNSYDCDFTYCRQGAACLLTCTHDEDCEFQYCAGGAVSCGNGVLACGRPCP